MNIKKNITINLSPNDIGEIICDYLSKEGYDIRIENIEFKVGTESYGYGKQAYEKTVFKGCRANCNEK